MSFQVRNGSQVGRERGLRADRFRFAATLNLARILAARASNQGRAVLAQLSESLLVVQYLQMPKPRDPHRFQLASECRTDTGQQPHRFVGQEASRLVRSDDRETARLV